MFVEVLLARGSAASFFGSLNAGLGPGLSVAAVLSKID
jgi:hypothetical protein